AARELQRDQRPHRAAGDDVGRLLACNIHYMGNDRVPVQLLERRDVEVGRDQLDVGLELRAERRDLRARGRGGEAVEVEQPGHRDAVYSLNTPNSMCRFASANPASRSAARIDSGGTQASIVSQK